MFAPLCPSLSLSLSVIHVIQVSALSSSTTMTSTLNTAVVGYRTLPVDVTVAEGESVAFGCGVAAASPNFTFTFYGSQRTYNLTCPNGYVEAIPQVSRSPPAPAFCLCGSLSIFLTHCSFSDVLRNQISHIKCVCACLGSALHRIIWQQGNNYLRHLFFWISARLWFSTNREGTQCTVLLPQIIRYYTSFHSFKRFGFVECCLMSAFSSLPS